MPIQSSSFVLGSVGAHTQPGTTTWQFPCGQIMHAPAYHRPIHDCDEGTTPKITLLDCQEAALLNLHVLPSEGRRAVDTQETELSQEQLPACSHCARALPGSQELEVGPLPLNQTPKHPFGLPQGSPVQMPCAAVRHMTRVECARKKWSNHKSDACSQCARALPVGQEFEVGLFPLDPNTKSQKTSSSTRPVVCVSHWQRPLRLNHRVLSLGLQDRGRGWLMGIGTDMMMMSFICSCRNKKIK